MSVQPQRLLQQVFCCALLGLAGGAMAQTTDAPAADGPYRWRVELSPHTTHFSYNAEHRPVHLIGLERESTADNTFYGLALFSNSFGQDSGYLYLGKSYYGVFDSLPKVYLKWSAGIIYGYKPPYENKVPLNYKGFSPGLIPGIGWRFGSGWNAQVDMLGTAGLTYSLVKEF
ncbi:ABC transporter ATP-binding protein [Rhodoferax sp.]|uniref:ABC transporter ATP-binding protein n=1 Tax=Rhodoferax sp. TaxID=50421 RepID=UPI00374CEF06